MAIKIRLRQKAISGNRQALYLDFYPAIPHPETGKTTRREFLNMYLNNEIENKEEKYFDKNGKEQKRFVTVLTKEGEPKKVKLNPIDKQHNKETLQRAEQIRQKRENHLNKPEIYTGYEKEQLKIKEQGEKNFVEYFKELADKRKASNHDNWVSAYKYLNTFTGGYKKFADLNEKFCEDFKEYLLTIKSNKSSKTTLAQNSAVSYFNKFKSALRLAYRYDFLRTDLNAKIDCIEVIEVIKQTLTIEELNVIVKTETKHHFVKKIILYSALTGMSFMEMKNLKWSEIEVSEAFGIRVKMRRKKTGKPYYINISEQAYSLTEGTANPKDMPQNKSVFEGLANIHRYGLFHIVLAEAGIKKEMTFHDLRHTYGCNQVDAGTDLYTLQGNMGHSTPRQSMHYGKISDQRKREAADKIKLDF